MESQMMKVKAFNKRSQNQLLTLIIYRLYCSHRRLGYFTKLRPKCLLEIVEIEEIAPSRLV
jgi:hypothetical protein